MSVTLALWGWSASFEEPKLGPRQVKLARQMYDETGQDGKRKYTVVQIAAELDVSCPDDLLPPRQDRGKETRHGWRGQPMRRGAQPLSSFLSSVPHGHRPPCPAPGVPYQAIRREFGSFSSALKAAGLPETEPGHRARKERAAGPRRPPVGRCLAARALPHQRSAPQAELPAADARGEARLPAAHRPQRRELRAQWLAARVILDDFAERRCCSEEIVINVHVSLDELISVLYAAVAFTEDEHLWRLALPEGTVGRPQVRVHGRSAHAEGEISCTRA